MSIFFLDVEASSLSNNSYPIEIAWGDEFGNIESHLINPYLYPKEYTDWAAAAEAIHGLSRDYLKQNGEDPLAVAKKMQTALSDSICVCDAPEFDKFWCRRLFEAVGLNFSLEFDHVESQLQLILPIEYWMSEDDSSFLPIQRIYAQAREEHKLPMHRAANDVSYLITLYNTAKQAIRPWPSIKHQ